MGKGKRTKRLWYVHVDGEGEVAACKRAAYAAAIVAVAGEGVISMRGAGVLWTEGAEAFRAREDINHCIETIEDRATERLQNGPLRAPIRQEKFDWTGKAA